MRRLASAFAFSLVLVAAPAAFADVVPPDVEACNGKAVGDSCAHVTGGPGVCRADKCTRLDYGSWDKDASASPPTVTYDCVRCGIPSGDAGTTDAGSTDAGGGGGSADDSSGCSMGVRKVGPWALALVPALALALLERRRNRR